MERTDFVVHFNKIPPEGLQRSWRVADPRSAGIEIAVPVEGPLTAELDIQRFEDEMRVTGEVAATLRLECSRCLAPFDLPVQAEVEAIFARRPEEDDEEGRELGADDLEVQYLDAGGGADLRAVIAEQVHLALPIKPLCTPDCRGICPRCGADLSGGACGCPPADADPRWAALRSLSAKG